MSYPAFRLICYVCKCKLCLHDLCMLQRTDLSRGLLMRNNDTRKLESEICALRSFIESLTSQCAAHEKTITATSTAESHQLLTDLEAAKKASVKVACVLHKEIKRRKTLGDTTRLVAQPKHVTPLLPATLGADRTATLREATVTGQCMPVLRSLRVVR